MDIINKLKPKYIFFPHWSHIVSKEILATTECICFHETDLPYGRGGSPIQNLIARGHKETVVTAFQMVEELDAGPIYYKRKLSLDGLAEEIYNRAAKIVAEMIKDITEEQVNCKVKAIEAYKSEARPDPHPRSKEVLKALAKVRGSESGFYLAEAFMLQRSFG